MLTRRLAAYRANRLALVFLAALAFVGLRLWYLAVVCRQAFEERANRPRFRSEVIAAERGAIGDRFGHLLATNRLSFDIAVRFGDVQNATLRELAGTGAGFVATRADYIRALSREIALSCSCDSMKVQDSINAKATLTPSLAVTVVENVDYSAFARLKLKSMRWPGLCARVSSRRHYPHGKTACHLVGHTGVIDPGQLQLTARDLRSTQALLEIEDNWVDQKLLRDRLENLQDQFQKRSARVGKAGLEDRLEPHLRGRSGEIRREVDARGRSLRLSAGGKPSKAGMDTTLSISGELQQFAETLLARSELLRENSLKRQSGATSWIKGGAIVALEPTTGEILALASSPGFDPNDFADQSGANRENLEQWMETSRHLGAIWDGLSPLQRLVAGEDKETEVESKALTWPLYLDLICCGRAHLAGLQNVQTFADALVLTRAFEQLCQQGENGGELDQPARAQQVLSALYPDIDAGKGTFHQGALRARFQSKSSSRAALEICDRYLSCFSTNHRRILALDLLRLLIDSNAPAELASCRFSLAEYREHAQAYFRLERAAKAALRNWFEKGPFRRWRLERSRYLLTARRLEEQRIHRPAKPYTDYIDQELSCQFASFWDQSGRGLLLKALSSPDAHALKPCTALAEPCGASAEPCGASAEPCGASAELCGSSAEPCGASAEPFDALVSALQGDHGADLSKLKSAAGELFQLGGAQQVKAYVQTFRPYACLNRPLLGRYRALGSHKLCEKDLARAFCPKGGFGYMRPHGWRTATAQGSIFKLVIAYEALRQRWWPGCQFEQINPLTMWDFVRQRKGRTVVGANLDGALIGQLHKGGRLPKSSRKEIGKIDLIGAITCSSNPYFSLLAADEMPLEDLTAVIREFGFGKVTGVDLPMEVAGSVPLDLKSNRTGLYNTAIGQHALAATPLQTARMLAAIANGGRLLTPRILPLNGPPPVAQGIFLPKEIRQALLEGMHRVPYSSQGCASVSAIRSHSPNSPAMRSYRQLEGQFVGKTSTAEIDEWCSLAETKPERCSHLWFGGISFESEAKLWTKPELVVVVFLRRGTFGKEAAPLAAEMVTKWREIKTGAATQSPLRGELQTREIFQKPRHLIIYQAGAFISP